MTVIGSGNQILNSILAGSTTIDCFDISVLPQFYLYLQIASILALSKEEYFKYYFSQDRDEIFCDELYSKISNQLQGEYKKIWDTLYMFDDGYDIYESLLFRHDICLKQNIINYNPYLQDNNLDKLKHILQTKNIQINCMVADITKCKFTKSYDLVNLSNILSYYYKSTELDKYINFLKNAFSLNQNGEIINYIFSIESDCIKEFSKLLNPNSYIEDLQDNKLLIYKK